MKPLLAALALLLAAPGPKAPHERALLSAENEIRAGHLAQAARHLARLAKDDRRAAWLATLCGLAAGDRKAAADLHHHAARALPGEEPLAELGWVLEAALAPTAPPEPLIELARTSVEANRWTEAALAAHAAQRIAKANAQVQALVDRLRAPRPAASPAR